MTAKARHILEVFVVITTVLATPGCAGHAKPADAARANVTDAVSGVAGVVAHTESAQRHVEQAIPHTDDTGKVHLAAALLKVAGIILLVPAWGANGMAALLSAFYLGTTGALVWKTYREIQRAETALAAPAEAGG